MKIAISSGHGLKIRGASDVLDEVNEARKVVEQVAAVLRNSNVGVETYHDDISTSQNENLNRIVNWHDSRNRDLDVSVHFNAYQHTSNPMGTECLYVTQQTLADKVSEATAKAGGFIDRGPKKRTDLFFLNNTDQKSILIETCFVDSTKDADLYNKQFNAVCTAIAGAISGVAVEQPPEAELPPTSPVSPSFPVLGKGDTGSEVEHVQRILGVPVDGDFGSQTDGAVKGFQAAANLTVDGVVGENTWRKLIKLEQRMEITDPLLTPRLEQRIVQIAKSSEIAGYNWDDRGDSPPGYIPGMALSFARAIQGLNDGVGAALTMASAKTSDQYDVLNYYNQKFKEVGMDNSQDGIDTLRHLFVLLIGLGMRETSGNHWCGRDQSATNTSHDTAEAGLMQSSWNLSSTDADIQRLFDYFWDKPEGFQPVFTEGLNPSSSDLQNYGKGSSGTKYQWLSKFCPAFTVFMCGVGLRSRCNHWGPVIRYEVELRPEADELLKQVQRIMEVRRE
jgi:peptidoglycan hydrolase-like protein with peptidoglycan-binding domain